MRFVFALTSWPRSTFNSAHQSALEQFNDLGDARRKDTLQQERTGQHKLHQAGRAAADTISALLHATGTLTEQNAQVLGKYFVVDIDDTDVLTQATDIFDFQGSLEAFETPPLYAGVGGTAAQKPHLETPVHPSW